MATILKFSRVLCSSAIKQASINCKSNAFGTTPLRQFSVIRHLFAERKYSEAHEWVTLEGNVGTVGISDYAQDKLGDIAYIQLPDDGAEFDRDDECGALESVKAASEIFSPVSGTITDTNTELLQKVGLINSSPYEKGWLFKIELSKPEEMNDLMDEEGYQNFLKSQDDD